MRALGVVLALALLTASGGPAEAADWFRAAYCDSVAGGCSLKDCERADTSPAEIYERNAAFGSKIEDGPEGRVDVLAQGARMVFFRSRAACMNFVNAQYRAEAERRQQLQGHLDKYR
jgi:hypothetical protein